MQTLKVLGLALMYPDAELLAATDEMITILRQEARLPDASITGLEVLLAERAACGLYQAQETHVALFDLNPGASLHLFRHVYGSAPERGPALVELLEIYRKHGLEISAREMPDYLPLFLEFASQLPDPEARELLSQAVDVFEALRARLSAWNSAYAAVFEALIELSARLPRHPKTGQCSQTESASRGCSEVDEDWEEKPVLFGEGACSAAIDGPGETPLRGLAKHEPL